MELKRKKPRPLSRQEGKERDARLFIIATEDTHAPKQYFRLFKSSRIKIQILPTEEGHSAPQHVMERLNEYYEGFELNEEDQLWLLLDTDHWTQSYHVHNFSQVCQQAQQKGFFCGHSNPCFEIWMLLHWDEPDSNRNYSRCADVIEHLRTVKEGYSKSNPPVIDLTREDIEKAIKRAESIDEDTNPRWPSVTGTHVYKLVNQLVDHFQHS